MLDQLHLDVLTELAGPNGATTDPDIIAPHLREWRDKFQGKTPLMLMPNNAETAAKIIKYCNKHCISLVPQGGNTGLVGGNTPGLKGRNEILISTKRLRNKIEVNPVDFSITADAGFSVAELQTAAANFDLLFPLSLASEGSCTVGGIVSTNAGGVHVIRYGTTRALTLGLEMVLPNGDIVDELSSLRKDNTGYNLSQLFIGAEGTLGFVSRATFKLAPPERHIISCWLAVKSPTDALSLLNSLKEACGERVSAFELMPQFGLDLVLRHIPNTIDPLGGTYPWYVLTDIATSKKDTALEKSVSDWLEVNLESGLIEDGAIATSLAQRQSFWHLRESMSEAQKHEGGSIKHDIAVSVSQVPAFLQTAGDAILSKFPGSRLTAFGHLGDGNIHFNVMQPEGANRDHFLANWSEMNKLVHDIVMSFNGSISAEHGIGSLKASELERVKPKANLKAMHAIKSALDPKNIMNPGVLIPRN